MQAAIVASTIANVNREKRRKPFEVKDFMPNFEAEPAAEVLAAAQAWHKRLGGT